MCAQQSLVIKLFLAAMKHYITHNPPARTEDIHGVSQPMPVFCFEVAGSHWNRIPGKRCHPARTGIKNILKNDNIEIIIIIVNVPIAVKLTTVLLPSLTLVSVFYILNKKSQ